MEDGSPVATYYSLTDSGTALYPVFEEIEAWADDWLEGDLKNPEA